MKIRMFVSDLDGTLLNSNHKISGFSAGIIRTAQNSGRVFLVATGRSWNSASRILGDAGITCGAVLLNGAEYRTKDGQVLFREYLGQEDTDRILSVLQKNELSFEMHTNIGDFAISACNTPQAPHGIRVLKIFIPCHTPEIFNRIKRNLKASEHINITASGLTNMEITSSGATKALMLKKAASRLGISEEEIAVFGDGENDKSMLQQFRHSFAMKNAPKDVQKCSASVIGTNEKEAVALQIQKIMATDRTVGCFSDTR